jgi:GNAT superfamily N-acetyltransferase
LEEIRLLSSSDEYEEAVRLSNETFRDAEQISMKEAYPKVFSPSLGQSFGLFVDGRLISFIGLVPSVVRIGAAELNVYSVGSVCTAPAYRGRGYAGAILKRIQEHIDQAGASLLLVSGYGGIYEKAGCHRFGDVTRFTLEDESARKVLSAHLSEDVRVRELQPTDWFAVKKVASERAIRFEQSVWDLAETIHAGAMASNSKQRNKVWVTEQAGNVTAFAVISVPGEVKTKGSPYAIEWAGDAKAAACLFAHALLKEQLTQLYVPVPWHDREVLSILNQAGCAVTREKLLGTVHIVNPSRLLRQAAPYLEQKNDERFRQLNVTKLGKGRYQVDCGECTLTLNDEELISLFFDVELKLSMPDSAKANLRSLFPLPFPNTSGLNYV